MDLYKFPVNTIFGVTGSDIKMQRSSKYRVKFKDFQELKKEYEFLIIETAEGFMWQYFQLNHTYLHLKDVIFVDPIIYQKQKERRKKLERVLYGKEEGRQDDCGDSTGIA